MKGTGWRWRAPAALAALALAVVAAGCGGVGSPAASTTTTGAAATTSTTTTTAPGATSRISLYWVRSGQYLAVSHRSVPATPAIGTAALTALLAGPDATETAAGLTSTVPSGSHLLGLSVAAGVATADFDSAFASGGGSFSTAARLAQVVFTLTQFPTVQKVVFQLNGATVTTFGSEGLVLDHAVARSDETSLLPAIFLESPAVGDTVHSPAHLTGMANTFEATFRAAVVDASGSTLVDRQMMASAGTGTWGTFDTTVPYSTTATGAGKIVVYEISAKDGSRINETDVPVTLAP